MVARRPAALAFASSLALLALAACGGPARAVRPARTGAVESGRRLASRASSMVGQAGPFRVGETRFNADCSGFVEAVYEAEGLPLRKLAARAAPKESSGVAAIHLALQAAGVVFGGGGEWPLPGDLVFFHDTYDRDRDGRSADPFTHVGIVLYVSDDGTVVFVHRGANAVIRSALTPDRPGVAKDADGLVRNSPLRGKGYPGRVLAGQLFAGYGRIATRE